jgi:hypothetical protein
VCGTAAASTIVDVTLTDMHGMMGSGGMMGPGMMGPGWNGPYDPGPNGYPSPGMGMAGMMRILINPATVPPGQVSFRVTNAGALNRNFSRWMSPVGVRRLSCRSPRRCVGLVG